MQYVKKMPVILLVLTVVSASAFAAKTTSDTQENDAIAVTNANITLKQAIDKAESHVKGTASKAKFEQSKLGPVYDIEIVQGKQVTDVKIDAKKGSLISSKVDVNDDIDSEDAAD